MKVLKRNYRWYAIYTRSRSEKKLYKELLDKGVESYLPLKKELRVWSDRKKWVESPLFTSYVFVKVSEREYYDAISSHWAVRYVCFEGRAVPIPDSQIESLKKSSLQSFVEANEKLFQSVPRIDFKTQHEKIVYLSSFNLVRSSMLPPTEKTNYDF